MPLAGIDPSRLVAKAQTLAAGCGRRAGHSPVTRPAAGWGHAGDQVRRAHHSPAAARAAAAHGGLPAPSHRPEHDPVAILTGERETVAHDASL